MKQLAELFLSPPMAYRPAPQWSWNGDLTRERITEQLEQFAAQGCGGLFPHARPGHVTGYLSDRWFELWGHAVQEAKRLGMQMNIYDEFMCPAGLAGGHVLAEDPSLLQQEIRMVTFWQDRPIGEVLLRLRLEGGLVQAVEKDTDATHAILLCAVSKGQPFAADLLKPETAQTFLRTTHERYRQQCSDAFGKTVAFMFSDEPMLLASGFGFPFSRYLCKEFHLDHGYALEGEKLLSFCFMREDSPEVRFDFWHTVNRLFNQNFMKPLHDWCEKHALLFTGHLMEHSWPNPCQTPDNMASLRWMHAPGEDLLGFQFAPTRLADNGLYLLNLKELASVGNQLKRDWRLVETCGARGYHTAFAQFKPCEDFTLAFGVNVIDPHLAHETLSGIGKYDWPQTMSDHSPWWFYYKAHADHVARVNTTLSQGTEQNRVLVLMPTTTGWMHYTGKSFDAACEDASKVKLKWIQKTQIDLVTALYENQIDFDLGDEFILEELGRVDGKMLTVGTCQYHAVVLPPAMENLNESTVALLRSYLQNGGTVHAFAIPERVNGRKSDAPVGLAKEPGWMITAGTKTLLMELRKQIPPYLSQRNGSALDGGLVWRRVVTAEGTVWFFCNPWSEPMDLEVRVAGASALRLDTVTGNISPLPTPIEGSDMLIRLQLQPRNHELLLVKDVPASSADTLKSAPPIKTPIELESREIQRLKPNLLFIDYCDVSAYGHQRANLNTALADKVNWQWQGFDDNPWDRQFLRTLIDRPTDPKSEFQVTYRFTVDAKVSKSTLQNLGLAVERPWLYHMDFNGVPVDPQSGVRWFDEEMRLFTIGKTMRPGENILTLKASPFHMLCQIMPIYVVGNFSLKPAAAGFEIVENSTLNIGDWGPQGMPFYPDAVRYTYAFTLMRKAQKLHLQFPPWEGSVAVVRMDGQLAGQVMHPPFECLMTGPVEPGPHTLELDVLGNMKNMMGSHHIDDNPLRWTYEYAPAQMPPGTNYHFHPTGLFEKPVMFAEEMDGVNPAGA